MVFWVICSEQLKPSLTMMVFGVVADGGEEDAFAECLGDLEFVFFEAEGAGHAAAAGVEELDVGSGECGGGRSRRVMPMVARWWQWPWTMIFSLSCGGR